MIDVAAATDEVLERFWSHVDKSGGPEACWNWTGSLRWTRYGQFQFCGRPVSTHKFSYTIAHGPVPDGHFVCHTCDNPRCGEDVHCARLTADDVREIRRRFDGGETQSALAIEFGVYQPAISKIIRRERWAHVK